LGQTINADFGSLEQLKSTFSAAVNGVSSQGYVWLLVNWQGHLAVYPTFGTGTLLARSGKFLPVHPQFATVLGEGKAASSKVRLQGPAGPTSSPAAGTSRTQPPSRSPTQTRSYFAGGYQAATIKVDESSTETLYPLFCISVHEHAWMSAGYGVWGKEEWTKKFWSVVDWERASQAFTKSLTSRK
jgi:superoxide dismutase, Fe-Mn family